MTAASSALGVSPAAALRGALVTAALPAGAALGIFLAAAFFAGAIPAVFFAAAFAGATPPAYLAAVSLATGVLPAAVLRGGNLLARGSNSKLTLPSSLFHARKALNG